MSKTKKTQQEKKNSQEPLNLSLNLLNQKPAAPAKKPPQNVAAPQPSKKRRPYALLSKSEREAADRIMEQQARDALHEESLGLNPYRQTY
jgi:hypothetical protein